MAIYTRWGNPVTITAYCGKHRRNGSPNGNLRLMLVRVRFEDGVERHAFASDLRANESVQEIEAAINAAPGVDLAGRELEAALRQAE